MTVDRIESLDKRRSKVFLDGDFAFVLSQGEIARYRLREGDSISSELYEEILWQVVGRRAREKALALLKTRGRTEYELREKLTSLLFPTETIEETIHFLKEYHYLDDEAYALNYVEVHGQKKSRAELEYALRRKGIDREVIHGALRNAGTDSREAIAVLLRKRGCCAASTPQEKQKAFAYLLRRGFSWEEIRAAIED